MGMIRCSLAVVILALGLLAISPAYAADPEEWQTYSQRLKAAWDAAPANEYIGIRKEGLYFHRQLWLWIKAGPGYQKDGTWARKATIFVDDTSGHRVRSVPDTITVQTEPPARLIGATRLTLKDGEVTTEIVYGAQQAVATLTVATAPPEVAQTVFLPRTTTERRIAPAARLPVDDGHAAWRLELAQGYVAKGKREYAGRSLLMRAQTLLRRRETQRAIEAFASCEAAFPESRWAVLCAFGQLESLRQAGQTGAASQLAARITRQYPDSIPAQFTDQKPGEIWIIPFF